MSFSVSLVAVLFQKMNGVGRVYRLHATANCMRRTATLYVGRNYYFIALSNFEHYSMDWHSFYPAS
jgi:hypothetical protein